jgi:hypothetical protein
VLDNPLLHVVNVRVLFGPITLPVPVDDGKVLAGARAAHAQAGNGCRHP